MVNVFAAVAADSRNAQSQKDAQVWKPPTFSPYDSSADPVILNHAAAKAAKKKGGSAAASTAPFGAVAGDVWMGGWDEYRSKIKNKGQANRTDYGGGRTPRIVDEASVLNAPLQKWDTKRWAQEKARAARALGVPASQVTTEAFLSLWKSTSVS